MAATRDWYKPKICNPWSVALLFLCLGLLLFELKPIPRSVVALFPFLEERCSLGSSKRSKWDEDVHQSVRLLCRVSTFLCLGYKEFRTNEDIHSSLGTFPVSYFWSRLIFQSSKEILKIVHVHSAVGTFTFLYRFFNWADNGIRFSRGRPSLSLYISLFCARKTGALSACLAFRAVK